MSFFSISFHTLGCKLNQLETESIAAAFRSEGFQIRPWPSEADLYLVNTCTVTSKAEQKARRIIRKQLTDNPKACVIATGCYAQMDGDELLRLSDRQRVIMVKGETKASLMALPKFLADQACSSTELPALLNRWSRAAGEGIPLVQDSFCFDGNDSSFHSRAFLKIQDGCDNTCAYCRVRLARGLSRSLESVIVLDRLKTLEDKGYAEVVLTGINVNQYRDGEMDFSGLLRFLIAGTSRVRLRISSTEPDGVDGNFAETVSHQRIQPHFHLSLQSGCDSVLSRMRRRYTSVQVEQAIRLLRSAKDDPFIACDIIAGFPGESDEDFEKTIELCEKLDFAWIHAFPFSPRPGTEAASMGDPVEERRAVLRVERLMSLARWGKKTYLSRWVGREVFAVAEAHGENSVGAPSLAVTENYLKVELILNGSALLPKPGSSLRCRILAPPTRGELEGERRMSDADAEITEITT